MKIIKNGYVNDKGIYFTCKYCLCEYVIENKNDWIIKWDKNLNSSNEYPRYITKCPECSNEVSIGYEPSEYKKQEGITLLTRFHSIFARSDWNDRFKVTKEEV